MHTILICTHCRRPIRVRTASLGKRVQCGLCQRIVQTTAPSPPLPAAPSTEPDQLRVVISQLTLEAAASEQQIAKLQRECEKLRETNVQLKAEAVELTGQLHEAAQFDGKWTHQVHGLITPFVPLGRGGRGQRRTPIVAVANLKGGVGKSTLTANLGATLWSHAERPRRVLLVDLDYQGSLTKLCLRPEDLEELELQGRYLQRLFLDDHLGSAFALKSRTPIPGSKSGGYILPANEKLAEAEERVKSEAVLGRRRDDARQILRQALHSEAVEHNYDIVLLDCPPRLTTACINAMACCDLVLIPVLLDDTSAESPPRLLTLLSEMRGTVFPEFPRVAVLANKRSGGSRLLLREGEVWEALKRKCPASWTQPVHYCGAMIRNFTEAARQRVFPALHPECRPGFEEAVDEVWQLLDQLRQPATAPADGSARKQVQSARGGVR